VGVGAAGAAAAEIGAGAGAVELEAGAAAAGAVADAVVAAAGAVAVAVVAAAGAVADAVVVGAGAAGAAAGVTGPGAGAAARGAGAKAGAASRDMATASFNAASSSAAASCARRMRSSSSCKDAAMAASIMAISSSIWARMASASNMLALMAAAMSSSLLPVASLAPLPPAVAVAAAAAAAIAAASSASSAACACRCHPVVQHGAPRRPSPHHRTRRPHLADGLHLQLRVALAHQLLEGEEIIHRQQVLKHQRVEVVVALGPCTHAHLHKLLRGDADDGQVLFQQAVHQVTKLTVDVGVNEFVLVRGREMVGVGVDELHHRHLPAGGFEHAQHVIKQPVDRFLRHGMPTRVGRLTACDRDSWCASPDLGGTHERDCER